MNPEQKANNLRLEKVKLIQRRKKLDSEIKAINMKIAKLNYEVNENDTAKISKTQ